MIPGKLWKGYDGTYYKIVRAQDVLPDQARWWIYEDEELDYMSARSGCVDGYRIGPEGPIDLYWSPLEPGAKISYALVVE